MDWRVRITWWCLLASVLYLALLTPEVKGIRGFGGRGGGSRGGSRGGGSGGRGSSSGGGWLSSGRNRDKGRHDTHSNKHVTAKPDIQKYYGWQKQTPKPKIYGTVHQTTSRPVGWAVPSRNHKNSSSVNHISHQKFTPKPTGSGRFHQTTSKPIGWVKPTPSHKYNGSFNGINHQSFKPTQATPKATTHHHRHHHQNHTKPSVSRSNATASAHPPSETSHGRGTPRYPHPTHQPQSATSQSWNVGGGVQHGSPAQPPGPGWNIGGSQHTGSAPAHPPGWNVGGTGQQGSPAQPPGPGWNVGGGSQHTGLAPAPAPGFNVGNTGSKQQPSAPALNPPHQQQPGWNVGSGTNTGRQPPYNPNYHGTQQAPPPYSATHHGTQQAPPPYSPPGQSPPAYNPNQPPPAYNPGRPPSYPGYPGQQPGYPGQQHGYPGYGHQSGYPGQQHGYPGYGHQSGYPQQPGYQPGYQSGYQPGYPGGGYHGYPGGGYQAGYAGGYYPGGGSNWSPPGYTSSYGMMPGLWGGGGGGGGLFSSSYHSSPFGYSKSFFRPSFPMIIFLPIPHYHYPSHIPPRQEWKCNCYVSDKTAVCTYKLKDDHIPSCVSSSVTAVFIQSRKIDRLAVDAFRHVPRLEYINITGTFLNSLPRDLFRDTPDLKHLLVQNNRDLRTLDSDLFRDANKLEDVILDSNDIRSLDKDLFSPLTKVRNLNLAYNKIAYLHSGLFRNNRELEELGLSGNPLHMNSDTARELFKNNGKLRVLLMRNCKLDEVPRGLLRNASKLEWLDLSDNGISSFPADFIEDCPKLAHLALANNKLKVLTSDVLYQRGGSLATLELEGNPWQCDCDLLPLAGWAVLRNDAVPDRPKCRNPYNVENQPLQRWFHSNDAMKCGGATSSLRTDLNRVLSVARAIAKEGKTHFTNLIPISDEQVSFAATNYFAYAMAARTDSDVDNVVWHWARLLEKVLDRRHIRFSMEEAKKGIDQLSLDRLELILNTQNVINISTNPLATTTTKPPTARNTERPARPKSFEALVNFTYILKDIPENTTKLADDGIEEELKIIFGVINATNATSLNTTSNVTALNTTGNLLNITISPTNSNASVLQNSTPLPVNISISNIITTPVPTVNASFTNSTVNMFPQNTSVVTTPMISSSPIPNVAPVAALPNTSNLTRNTSTSISINSTSDNNRTLIVVPLNQNATNTTSLPSGANTTVTSNNTDVVIKKMNATEMLVSGLRSELREVLSTLLLSIDRAKWDAAYQKAAEESEKKEAQKPKPPSAEMTSRNVGSMAESFILKQHKHSLLVTVIVLFTHCMTVI